MRLIVFSFAILLVTIGPAAADITAKNAHNDRTVFERCRTTMGVMSESLDRFRAAVAACNNSAAYYAQRARSAKSKDTRCLALLYAGSSLKRYAYILGKTTNQQGSLDASYLADRLLGSIPKECPGEPNILLLAKTLREPHPR